ncbi:MAG: hypothetical protein EZS28_003371 [Streblomastix strix]|uniref:Uncharacterized protein n=1 Tax=Streblomastix strix TaxID=222440 RepID=A0A5J4X2W7_9EUKA|nr:MAG: hypothetical protein EZS28_003371 [Streblomastix strix]
MVLSPQSPQQFPDSLVTTAASVNDRSSESGSEHYEFRAGAATLVYEHTVNQRTDKPVQELKCQEITEEVKIQTRSTNY